MNLKTKIAKRALAWIVAVVMVVATIGFNASFSAFADVRGEADFTVDRVKNLPTDDEFLELTKTLPREDQLQTERGQDVRQSGGAIKKQERVIHADGVTEYFDIDEKSIFMDIYRTVSDITKDFEPEQGDKTEQGDEPEQGDKTEQGDKEEAETKSSNDLSVTMQKASAIYEWVAKNIKYDFETAHTQDSMAQRKPQDAYFVFATKSGVCAGFSNLLTLMMRMADIPCVGICSNKQASTNCGHAFNAIYIDEGEDRKGWTLLDSCWAAPDGSDGDEKIKKHVSGGGVLNCKADARSTISDIVTTALGSGMDTTGYGEALINQLTTAVQRFGYNVDNFNSLSASILSRLKSQYPNSSCFEQFNIYFEGMRVCYTYRTNLNLAQAKQIEDNATCASLNKTYNLLTGKYWQTLGETNSLLDDSKPILGEINMFLTPIDEISDLLVYLFYLNGDFAGNRTRILDYYSELTSICANSSSNNNANSNDVGEKLKNIKNVLNQELNNLSAKYSDIKTVKGIDLKTGDYLNHSWIYASFTTDLTEEEWATLKSNYLHQLATNPEALKKNQDKIENFFPACYKKDQSVEAANRSVAVLDMHKTSLVSLGLPESQTPKDKEWTLKANAVKLDIDSVEGNGRIYVQDCYLDDIGKWAFDEASIDSLYSFGLPVDRALYRDHYDRLVLKGDSRIVNWNAAVVKEIDVSQSSRYFKRGDILWERTSPTFSAQVMWFFNGEWRTYEKYDSLRLKQNTEVYSSKLI